MAGAAVAVAVSNARREIVRHLTQAGATTPERAMAFDPDLIGRRHTRIRRRLFKRMLAYGAVREPKPGRFYLDEGRLDEFRWVMKRRALGLVAVASAAVAAIVALT